MPAKAGIQKYLKILVSRLCGNDAKGRFKTFYETIKIRFYIKHIPNIVGQILMTIKNKQYYPIS